MRSLVALIGCAALALRAASAAEIHPRPRITGLSHLALWVSDLPASLSYYEGTLGFQEPYALKNADGGVSIAWIKVNDRQTIELFPKAGPSQKDGDSLYHVSFETDDADGMLTYLRANGVRAPGGRPLPERAPKGKIGNANFFTEDPDGHIIEFTQYLPDSWTTRNAGRFMPTGRISRRMSHAGVTVRNLGESLRFYRDVLGFAEFGRGSSDGRTLSWVNLRVPDGEDYIELMLVGSEPDQRQLHVLNHLCLEVPSAVEAFATLQSRPIPAACRPTDPVRTGHNRKRQVNSYDPDGTRVEMMEASTVDGRPPESSEAPAPVFH